MTEIVLPSHAVLAAGNALRVEMTAGANATAAKLIPGCLVILDTTENQFKEAGAKAHGILGIIDVDPTHDIGDAYAVGDNVPILIPQDGAIVALTLLANEDVIQGDSLVSAANGLVAELAPGAMGGQGDIVGLSWDTSAVASDARILVRWSYQPEADTAS